MYDVCIVGAGPAGSTFARLLSGSYRVLLVDPRQLGAEWRVGDLAKPCGGLLAPRAQAELAGQGLGIPRSVISGPQLFAVRARDLESDIERLYQRFYVNVDREAFDRWLVSLVPDRVDVAWGWRAEAIDCSEDAPFVRFRTAGGGSAGVRARLVVGADGAASMTRRVVAGGRAAAPYVAVQGRFATDDFEPHYGALFDGGITDFYGWTIPKGDSLVVGVAMLASQGAIPGYEAFVDRLRARGVALLHERSREAAALRRPSGPGDIVLGRERIALVGEAAGLVSPSSAEGISYALRSAAALAQACDDGLEGVLGRYRRAVLPVTGEVCAKLVKAKMIHGPVVRQAVMRSGVGSLGSPWPTRGVFPELVAP